MSDARRRITYAGLWSEVRRFAEFLRRQGVRRGDVVTLQLPNRIEFPVVFFSLELIGAVANKISADFRAVEVDYILRFSKSRAYVCAGTVQGLRLSRDDRRAASEAARPVARRLRRRRRRRRRRELRAAWCTTRRRSPRPTACACRPSEVMRMCFTSGTTGNPKGVLHCFNTTLCTCAIVQPRARRHRPRRDARLPAGRPQLGLHDARAGGDGRRARRADGAVLRRRRARADREGARHVHPHRARVDRRDDERRDPADRATCRRCAS